MPQNPKMSAPVSRMPYLRQPIDFLRPPEPESYADVQPPQAPPSPAMRMPQQFKPPPLPPEGYENLAFMGYENPTPQKPASEGPVEPSVGPISMMPPPDLKERDTVLQGLKAALPAPPTPHPAMRNQAAVEALVHKLGLGASAANGSISQSDLESADVQMNQFADEMERLKTTSPRDVARINAESAGAISRGEIGGREHVANIEAASNLARQQEASRGALGVESERQSGKGSQYDLVREMMGGGFGNKTPKSISVPGVMGATFQNDQPQAALFGALDRARKAYDNSRGPWAKMMGGEGDPTLKAEVARLEGMTGLSQEQDDPEIASFAQDILADPDVNHKSWEDLQANLPQDLTPRQREQLHRILQGGR